MTRSTWNPNSPAALGLEFLGVGVASYSFPSTGLVQRGLRFKAQRTGPVDKLTLYSGSGTSVPTLSSSLFAGHQLPYVAELVPASQLDTGGPHQITVLTSSIVAGSTGFAHYPGGGSPQANDLASTGTTGVNPTASSGKLFVHFPTADSFPLDRQVVSVAVEYSAFATNLRAVRRGDRNVAPVLGGGGDVVTWSRVITGGTGNWHMGELWVEGGDTTTWHEVTPTTIRQFDSAVGNRRMELQVVTFNPNFAYDLFRLHVDHVPERRIGTGVVEVPSGFTNQRDVLVEIPFHAPGATGTPVQLVAGQEYVLVVRNPYGGSTDYSSSSTLQLRNVADQKDASGVFTHFDALDWDWHDVSNYASGDGTQALGPLLTGLPTAVFSVTGAPTVDSQPYTRTVGGRASQATDEVLRQHNVPNPSPATEYRSFRFNVSVGQTVGGGTGSVPQDSLQVSFTLPGLDEPFLGPFSVAPDDVVALGTTQNVDELGQMYFPVTVDFGEGTTFPALFDVVFRSVASASRPWRVATLQSLAVGGDQTYGAGTPSSFASGRALFPVGGLVQDLNVTTLDDVEFTLFTQAPEVTGLDVSVLQREAHGATCQSDPTAPTPDTLVETFNKVDGALGPDLAWSREVYDHEFVQVVASQRARFRVDEPGTWEDVQVSTPNFTEPDVRVELDLTSIAVTGSPVTGAGVDEYQASAGVVTRARLLGDGDDYAGYAVVVGRDRRFASPTEQWHLALYRVDGRDSQVLLGLTTLPLASVTLPGTLTLTSTGSQHVARFTHAGSGATLAVQATDDTYRGGVTFLRPRVFHALEGRVTQLEYDQFELTQLATGECTTCRVPRVTYPRVCWTPTQLSVEDFTHFELQRQEPGGEFETVAFLEKQDTTVTAVGAAQDEDDELTDHPAPSLVAVGDELLFCWWHAWQPGDYSVSGTGMNPLGTALQTAFTTNVGAQTPDRPELHTSTFDVRAKLSLTDWTPGVLGLILTGQFPNVAGQNGWFFSVGPTGELVFQYSVDGTTFVPKISTVPTGFVDGTVHYVRVTFVGNNGAGQNVTRFFTSVDGVTWTALGATITTAGVATVFNATGPLRVGDTFPVAATGQVHWVEVRTEVDGPVVVRPDFHSLLPGTTVFEDDYDNTWTLYGGASVVAANEWTGADTSSVAAWQQVPAGATGTRVAEISPARNFATMSVLVRGVEGPPVLEEVVTNLGVDGVTLTTSSAVKRGMWLLALFGSPAGATEFNGETWGPPTPGNWEWQHFEPGEVVTGPTGVTDSHPNGTAADRPRVSAWVRPVTDDGPQTVTLPQTSDPFDPWDYHFRVVVLSNVAEFIPSCYDDWSVVYAGEVCYRVRQGRSDGSVSDYSAPVCETVSGPTGVDLVFTVPARPELNAAYNEAHATLPTEREYTFLDAGDTVHMAVYGRDNQLAFRPTERRGVRFRRNLLVSPLCEAEVPCLDAVKPLVDLMVEPVPVVVVRDTCGNRWYASVVVDTAVQLSSPGLPDLWTAQVSVTELAAPVVGETTPVEAHSELA